MGNTNNNPLLHERDVQRDRPEAREKSRHYRTKASIGNLHLFNPLDAGLMELPTIAPYYGPMPERLVPFHLAGSSKDCHGFIHFYIDDYRFERLWTNPEKYLALLKRFDGVIGTDFSQLGDMPYPQRLWNCYRNRLLGHWMQYNGINYIHNVSWSLPDSYDYSFSGLPKASVIAINCSGISGTDVAKYLWYKGYEEAVRRLNPSAIVRYGTKLPEEKGAISRYFENERLNLLRYGR